MWWEGPSLWEEYTVSVSCDQVVDPLVLDPFEYLELGSSMLYKVSFFFLMCACLCDIGQQAPIMPFLSFEYMLWVL